MRVHILGAGISGLLAGRRALALGLEPIIYERQQSLPNNHHSVYRFRTPSVGEALNLPFREVTVLRDAAASFAPRAVQALIYSRKSSGVFLSDRSFPLAPERVTRYVAPPDFVQRLADPLHTLIRYGSAVLPALAKGEPVISTIPMPALAAMGKSDISNLVNFEFSRLPVSPSYWVWKARLANADAYASIYDGDPSSPLLRVSLTGAEVIAETNIPHYIARGTFQNVGPLVEELLGAGGFTGETYAVQQYAKIAPIPDGIRRRFIYEATNRDNIYSLGRYATWRPGLLTDDVLGDVDQILHWIKGDGYQVAKKQRGAP